MAFNSRYAAFWSVSSIALLLGNLPVSASIITPQREVDYYVHFSQSDFSDAYYDVKSTNIVAPGSSGSVRTSGGYPSLNEGVNFFATGEVSIYPGSVPAGNVWIPQRVTVKGAGTYGFELTAPAEKADSFDSVDFRKSSLAYYPNSGLSNLELASPSSGFLDQGGTWITDIYFPGNWSKASSGDVPGTHVVYFVDPLWTISNDFVYDPTTDLTLFSVVNTNYPGQYALDSGPFPDVALIGPPAASASLQQDSVSLNSAAPEPNATSLLLVGIAASVCLSGKVRAMRKVSSADRSRRLT